ncbi:MAG: immunoglobulin domain-containing protein [Saprospiraceae bacterium]|nr:immunoglobulin domain-containing protein [Saprospiraceae bacterium]
MSNITTTETSGTTNNDGNLCEGDDVTLQAFLTDPNVPGPDYSWDGPNGYTNTGNPITIDPVDLNHTGTYTVTVTDDNGCTFSSSTTLTINALPVFTIEDTETSGAANDDETVCVGDPFTLTANFTVGAGSTYAWNLPDGSSSTTHPLSISAATIAAHNGTFNLTVTDASGCTNTSSIMMTIEALPAVSNTELRACAISEGSTSGDFVLEDAEEVPNYPTNQNFAAEIDNGIAMTVTYHLSLVGAQTGTANASSGVFTDGTIIYARGRSNHIML